MDLLTFTRRLSDSGRVRVPEWPPGASIERPDRALSPDDRAALADEITAIDRRQRLDLGHPAPSLDRTAARWAFATLYVACRGVVSRSVETEALAEHLESPMPAGAGDVDAATHYSVDLGLRYFPDLIAIARARAQADPLVERATHFLESWPLSSVGLEMRHVTPIDAAHPVLVHPALRQLYLDRVIDRADRTRAAWPAVRAHLEPLLIGLPENEAQRLAPAGGGA